MCAKDLGPQEIAVHSRSSLTSSALKDAVLRVLSGHWTCADIVGGDSPLPTAEKETNVSHLICNYYVQSLPGDAGHYCDNVAIRQVIWPPEEGDDVNYGKNPLNMSYCGLHWRGVKDLEQLKGAQVTDLVEDEC
jgi:hypothetical protein